MLESAAALLIVMQLATPPSAPNEITDALGHAQALYYEAKFKDSIDLLSRIDEVLRPQTGRLQDKITVKLQLALAHIGLNDGTAAKSWLREMYALDPDYSLDSQQYSPKVINLAAEAKAEQNDVRCQAVQDDARKKLDGGNAKAVLDLIGSMKSKCSGLTPLQPELAELFYKAGFEAYKRSDFSNALQNLQTTLKLSPKHELATQYIELTQSRLQVAADRLFLQWQRDFASHAFVQAAADYHQLTFVNDEATAPMIAQAREEYRKALTNLVESFNRACMTGDGAGMNAVRAQMSDLLPEQDFGEDIREQMTTCTKNGCLQMNATLAMARLKTRVNPEITPALQSFIRGSQVTVRVKARIDENGTVTVSEARGTNPSINSAVRGAVERWKFSPILDQNGSRCVDTEIPIVLGSTAPSNRP